MATAPTLEARGQIKSWRRAPLEAGGAVHRVDGMRVVEPVRQAGGVGEQVPQADRLGRRLGDRVEGGALDIDPGCANSGNQRAIGSVSSKAPSSKSIIAATEVIGLVIENMRHSVSTSTGRPASMSRARTATGGRSCRGG